MPLSKSRSSGSGVSLKDKLKGVFKRKSKTPRASIIIDKNDESISENSNGVITPSESPLQLDGSTHDTTDNATTPLELTEETIQILFEGAPQFSIDDNDNPKAEFPLDRTLIVREATDYVHLEHPAFSLSTARSHLIPGLADSRGVAEYNIGTVEIPSMLSAQGKEPGSVGFDHFLEGAIPDTLNDEDERRDAQDSIFDENPDLLQTAPEKLGIRKFDVESIGERLIELSGIYEEYKNSNGKMHLLKRQNPGELYSMLFTQILTPPSYDSGANDPTGIKVQIQVLLRILKLKSIWFDFSSVEWRIRIGQILWTDILKQEASKDDEEEQSFSERHILILQIALSCELLLRLDAISAISTQESDTEIQLTSEDILEFRKRETTKTRWDLLLARTFLRNVEPRMTKKQVTVSSQSRTKSFFTLGTSTTSKEQKSIPEIAFVPRDLEQQLSGLFHWAKLLSWPDISPIEEAFRTKLMSHAHEMEHMLVPSVYTTPQQTPRSVMSGLSSYFDARPHLSRSGTPRSFQLLLTSSSSTGTPTQISSGVEENTTLIGGWLTRTYITGLVLPGESISHFLISSLLENDPAAIARLGDSACLYGGIVYRSCSWWSKSCAVGRVMAAVKGSRECMGWIYVPKAPKDAVDGWYDIESATPLERKGVVPRIRQREEFGRDAAFLGGRDVEDVTVQDLVVPLDSDESPSSTMWFDGLYLKATQPEDNLDVHISDSSANPQIITPILPPQQAYLRFAMAEGDKSSPELHIPLLHLIQFISAYPCFPPSTPSTNLSVPHESTTPNAHRLHISHTFRIIKAQDLFSDISSQSGLGAQDAGANDEGEEHASETLVIDARYDATLELLTRAWCSWKGENALIGRVKVTCLACCVREARALGVRIVIRVE